MDEVIGELSKALNIGGSLDENLGSLNDDLSLFCDFGGDDREFLTVGYYVLPDSRMVAAQPSLSKIRMKHGIESEFSWKKRKKGARHRAIGEWMKVIRTTPGIGYALAIDSRLRHHPFYRGPIKKLAASEGESPEIIWRIIWICMFAALIGRHLRNESTLRVYFDPDPYKETKGREEMIRNTLYHYLDVLKVDQPCRTMLCRKIEDRELEEFLSVADLIASSFSGSLRRDGSFSPPDDYATDILKQFGAMKTVGKEGLPVDECVFGASLVL